MMAGFVLNISYIGIHSNETADLLAKNRNQTSKQTPHNFETIKRLIKQKKQKKTRRILPGSHCLIQQDTVAKHYNYLGKQQKQTQKTSSHKYPAQHRS